LFPEWVKKNQACPSDPYRRKVISYIDNSGGNNMTAALRYELYPKNMELRFCPTNFNPTVPAGWLFCDFQNQRCMDEGV
jgi:hypothetical protein